MINSYKKQRGMGFLIIVKKKKNHAHDITVFPHSTTVSSLRRAASVASFEAPSNDDLIL